MPVESQSGALRIAVRLANGFVLDLVKRAAFGMDVRDSVLLAAITQANLSHLQRVPELQRRYASLSRPMDDVLRRPVSISGVAGSLRMPFETARRRIARLVKAGVVEAGPRGLIVPSGPLASTAYYLAARANYALVRDLYDHLSAACVVATTRATGPASFSLDDPPIRLVARFSADYALRIVDPIAEYMGDLVAGLVLMDIVNANTEHLPIDPAGDAALPLGPEGFPADHLRRPVRTADLARRLNLPVETVRRKLAMLMARDRCERSAAGYIVPARVLAAEPLWSVMQENRTQLLRLFATLGEYGVLDLWRMEGQPLRGAA